MPITLKQLLSVLLVALAFPVSAQIYPRILDTPKMKEWLMHNLGGEFAPNTPDQFEAFLATDTRRWMKIIEETGVRFD